MDNDELVASMVATATQISVTFNNHVTEKAVANIVTRMPLNFSPPAISCVAIVAGKVVIPALIMLARINPSTSQLLILVINSKCNGVIKHFA